MEGTSLEGGRGLDFYGFHILEDAGRKQPGGGGEKRGRSVQGERERGEVLNSCGFDILEDTGRKQPGGGGQKGERSGRREGAISNLQKKTYFII